MEMDRGKDLHPGLGNRKRDDAGTSLGEDATPDDGSCCPPLLPKHKIFLSHSGKQKWFVEKLCEDLEARYRFPFFDKRPSSLPKGERFRKLILEAAERCEMAVVVVSDEFMTSKWPMIELSTFVRALSGSNPGLKILPLFFGMSVSDFGSRSRQGAWSKVWKMWAREDSRIKLADLKEALKVMRSFNGMVFNGDMNNVWRYEKDVVREICSVVRADVKWEDSHVQGRSSICEATRKRIREIKLSESGIRVFGYYGVGGIGKTTMCKTLCNELSDEFSSKVCHVELGDTQSVEEMLKKMLKELTNTSEEELQKFDVGECRNILKNRSCWRQRTFLAIDNVWDDHKSMEQAEMFLQVPVFYEGSVVMVTSRCRSTLIRVGIEESHCSEVPELGDEDARKLFLHHVAGGKQFGNDGDNVVIDECIARCWFQKSETQGYHYLPLALKVLGVHLRRWGPSPAKWLVGLREVRDFNRFVGDNPVFSIIRLNFDRLSMQLQALFMDVAVFWQAEVVFWRSREYVVDSGYFSSLSVVHRQKLQDTQSQLQELKERGLLEDVNMESERVSIHDLYKEFAEVEAEVNSSEGLNNRKWVWWDEGYLSDLERTPPGGCWENLMRMNLDMMGDGGDVLNLGGIQWRYFSNLVVLTLYLPEELAVGVLNLEELRCLRSLRLLCGHSFDGVDGLKDLKNLMYYQLIGRVVDKYSEAVPLGQLPASIKILHFCDVGVCLRSDMFDRCKDLLELSLGGLVASGCIDLRQCTSLRSVNLRGINGLLTLLVPSNLQSSLLSLAIVDCVDLSGVSGLVALVGLLRLDLDGDPLLEVPDLQNFPNLQRLDISDLYMDYSRSLVTGQLVETCQDAETCVFVEIRGLGGLEQLREIFFRKLDARELPNLNALKHLHTLTLQKCRKLTHLKGMEGLTVLQRVNLIECSSLSRLPDLSNSTKLESLNLSGSGIELHEEDLKVLAALPGLVLVRIRTVSIGSWYGKNVDLDPVRRKLVISGMQDGWFVEERDLKTLPIQLRSL